MIRTLSLLPLIVAMTLVGCGNPPVGVVMRYAPAPGALSALEKETTLEELAQLVDRRINADRTVAKVLANDAGEIEIQVYGDDDDRVKRIERLLAMSGELAFRIVADGGRPQEAFVVSTGMKSDALEIRDSQKKLRGRWVPIATDPKTGELKYQPEDYDPEKKDGLNWRR
ncbi:MAG: hypothetical protein N2C14_28405, partial [Planctomycetales bacterium]